MNYSIRILPYRLEFKQPAGTSRGVYTSRPVWYVIVTSSAEPEKWGVGECAPLPDLSMDSIPDYEETLSCFCKKIEEDGFFDPEALQSYPSMLFGLETAFQHFEQGSFALWDTPFSKGETGIPINGLIWMGEYDQMLAQIEKKMESGFRCIKLKIGAIDFEKELDLLRKIRNRFPEEQMEIRVDANGAFRPDEALEKLKRLSDYQLHSIEQPIRAGEWEEMAQLTALTPIPIALDEELIGWNHPEEKEMLLERISPQYIILKPSLHGGMAGCMEWIETANQHFAGWWITSALESNIGLNAIAQWCATLNIRHPQGLGTGMLYTNNIPIPLEIRRDELWFDPAGNFPLLNELPF